MSEPSLSRGASHPSPGAARFGPTPVHPARVPSTPAADAGRARVIRVLIIDAHPITRWGLGRMAAGQPDLDIVGEAGTAAEALRLVAGLRPDVVTVGLELPDRDGLELVRELRDRDARLGLVVLSSQNEDAVLFGALDTGASAFVAKTASLPEILGAIRHAAVSASSFSAAGLAQAMSRRTEQQARRPLLSPRESEVLGLLQQGKSVPEVAGAMFVSLSTAKTYVSRLYDKLGATNRAQAMMAAVQLNLANFSVAAAERSQFSFG
jgi:DNA-binding NarL/FixJ family response regulator